MQDVTTMMRQNLNAIIFLINNRGYSIEVEIHDGPAENNYNDIQNWDYVALVKAMDNGSDKVYAVRVDTEDQLKAAIEAASTEQKNRLVFIECTIDRDDCSKVRQHHSWHCHILVTWPMSPSPNLIQPAVVQVLAMCNAIQLHRASTTATCGCLYSCRHILG